MATKDLYKVCVLDENGAINHIIVYDTQDITNDEERFQNSFSENEKAFIESNNTNYRFSKQQIHKDDTIKTIKTKIVHDLNYMYAYEELYLFSKASQNHNNEYIYDNYVGEQRILNNAEFLQLAVNYSNGESLKTDNDSYTKSNFLELPLNSHTNVCLGRGFQKRMDPIFAVNPYDILSNETLSIVLENQLLSFENHVLLHYKNADFLDNIIYVGLATNVLTHCEKIGLNEETILTLYFPLLFDKNITSKYLLREHRESILSENKKKFSEGVFKNHEKVDLFYNVYNQRKNELDYTDRGIFGFYVTIYPEFKYVLPLDAIFKNIHAVKEVPFIKYNPGLRRENLYRFYSENITKYGEKIPYLPKNTIIKLSKDIGKSNQISFFVAYDIHDIYIDVEHNGNINVYGNLKNSVMVPELEKIIKQSLNGVLININDFLQKSGYKLKLFDSLYDPQVSIVEVLYRASYKLKEKLTINAYENCLKSIYDIVEDDIQDGAVLRFKRIDNYTEMTAQDIYITELIKRNNTHESVVNQISKYYDVSITEASQRYSQFIDDHNKLEGQFANKTLTIADSPGLLCEFRVEGIENIFTATITVSKSIEYVNLLHIYIDSLLRMSQQPKSTKVLKSDIMKICQKKPTKKEEVSEQQMPNVMNLNRVPEPSNVKPYMFEEDEEEDEPNITEDIMFRGEEFEDDEDQDNDVLRSHESSQNIDDGDIITKKESEFGDLEQYADAFLTEADFEVLKEAPTNVSSNLMFSEEFEEFEDDEEESQTGGGRKKKVPEEISLTLTGTTGPTGHSGFTGHTGSTGATGNTGSIAQGESQGESQDIMDEPMEEDRELNIDNMKLKEDNANIFLTKMRKLDPVLFSTTNEGKFKSYSSICQWSDSRQPIPLTNKEKEDIEQKYPGSINYAINYGSDPKKKNWYVCPKYWCLKTNAPMSEEDIKAGKCGKEIPRNASTVPTGHYYYKFNDESVPGFITGKHSKGHCLPCCFKRDWDSSYMADRRKECEGNQPSKSLKKTKSDTSYIISVDTYPIERHRKGFLPMSVQLFLQTDNSLSVKKENNSLLKDRTQVFLRYGVEQTSNKSFVGCIADLYSTLNTEKKQYSIYEMCQHIVDSINIDIFLKIHNGSFFSIFKPNEFIEDDIDISKYEDSDFIKGVQQGFFSGEKLSQDIVLETIAAYENFVEFLTNENSVIDYTFLWDIVCSVNPKLFSNGLNLAILNILENDMRDNIELICPTSTYSTIYYDNTKPTFILLKHGEFFEPIYMFDTQSKESEDVMIRKLFYESQNVEHITRVLKIIRNSTKQFCSPLSSLPRTYEFKQNIDVDTLVLEIMKLKYTIVKQIVNYQRKTIGLHVLIPSKNIKIYLPCAPSALLQKYDMTFMDDPELYLNYLDTRDMLEYVSKQSQKRILCKPIFKTIEDGLIVGIITETNQFIMLDEPSENIYDDQLKTLKGENYILADKEITTNKFEDLDRVNTIRKISLETQFYEVFRYITKILLNEFENNKIKQTIQELIENPKKLYSTKLKAVEKLIHNLCDHYVKFVEYDEMTLMSMSELSDCRNDADNKKYCLVENGNRKLLIPKYHLLSGVLNSKLYFERLSDEILRYKRIQSFMMDPKSYLNIINNHYSLNKQEMILIDSLINTEYFARLKPFQHTGTANLSYDIAQPIVTQKYSNNVSLVQQNPDKIDDLETDNIMEIECINEKRSVIGNDSSYWKKVFPKKTKELLLNKTYSCTYFVIIHIFKYVYDKTVSVENLKTSMKTIYAEYMKNDKMRTKILEILKTQGKRKLVESVLSNKITFEDMLMNETYNLSGLDVWMLSHHLKLPIILYSTFSFKTMVQGIKWLNLCSDFGNKPVPRDYFFVRYLTEKIQGKQDFSSEFTLLETPMDLKSLGENFEEEFKTSSQNKIPIRTYLESKQK